MDVYELLISLLLFLDCCMLGNATALHDPEKTKQFREQIAELSMAVLEKSICSYISNNLVSYKCFIYIEESKKALSHNA